MSDQAINEQELKENLSLLARASIENLQRIFTTAPLNLSWDEIEERLKQGAQLKDICRIPQAYFDKTYAEGKEKLAYQDYEGAKEIFARLCLYDQRTPKYWGALGKCCEKLEYYPEAIDCYRMLLLTSGGAQALPYLCLGYCYLCDSDKHQALEMLESGRDLCDPYDHEQRAICDQFDSLIKLCRQ